MSNPILLCTVGGAHQPILRAIESTSPRYVCFFCTDRDPGTGRPGSIVQVTGKGNVIKAGFGDAKPTLPNIPAQAGLDAGRFEARTIPADDLDGACFAMRAAAAELAERFPGARFVADYTGGTKTMTAALVCAALERDDVELQLIAGARPNLVRVEDGTERAMTASVARLRLDRAMAPWLGAWRRFAYHEAADGLSRIRIAATSDADEARLDLARVLSQALARWDDFDHGGALDLIEAQAARVAPCFPEMLPALRRLADEGDAGHEPARLFDLWLNVERRAAQGRFDDAVARWYRLVEWTAQWQLRTVLGVDTADFPRDLLPPDAATIPSRDGKIKIGVWQTWQVVEQRLPGPAQAFIAEHGQVLRDLLDLRNNSILAHGFRPVGAADWKQVSAWTRERFMPVLRALATDAGLKSEPTQLPTELPESFRSHEPASECRVRQSTRSHSP